MDIVLTSNPPQSKCKNCGQTWFCNKDAPDCKSINMTTPEKTKDWREEFDELFGEFQVWREIDGVETGTDENDIKDFIQKTLDTRSAQLVERGRKVVEEIEKQKEINKENRELYFGLNIALSIIKDNLKLSDNK